MQNKEHPILFSAPIVRAILEGKKTQTRRVITPQPPNAVPEGFYFDAYDGGPQWNWWTPDHREANNLNIHCCPYGKAEDRLWVRETFVLTCDEATFDAPVSEVFQGIGINQAETRGHIIYRATNEYPDVDGDEYHWKPSIFMPRWASRITLEITEIRVQRLQEITKEDVLAEGLTEWEGYPIEGMYGGWHQPFATLWDSINAKNHPWESDPWIWKISFRRIT